MKSFTMLKSEILKTVELNLCGNYESCENYEPDPLLNLEKKVNYIPGVYTILIPVIILVTGCLAYNKKLRELDISGNGILNSGARVLAQSLSVNKTLRLVFYNISEDLIEPLFFFLMRHSVFGGAGEFLRDSNSGSTF